jgi:hypothetical protein
VYSLSPQIESGTTRRGSGGLLDAMMPTGIADEQAAEKAQRTQRWIELMMAINQHTSNTSAVVRTAVAGAGLAASGAPPDGAMVPPGGGSSSGAAGGGGGQDGEGDDNEFAASRAAAGDGAAEVSAEAEEPVAPRRRRPALRLAAVCLPSSLRPWVFFRGGGAGGGDRLHSRSPHDAAAESPLSSLLELVGAEQSPADGVQPLPQVNVRRVRRWARIMRAQQVQQISTAEEARARPRKPADAGGGDHHHGRHAHNRPLVLHSAYKRVPVDALPLPELPPRVSPRPAPHRAAASRLEPTGRELLGEELAAELLQVVHGTEAPQAGRRAQLTSANVAALAAQAGQSAAPVVVPAGRRYESGSHISEEALMDLLGDEYPAYAARKAREAARYSIIDGGDTSGGVGVVVTARMDLVLQVRVCVRGGFLRLVVSTPYLRTVNSFSARPLSSRTIHRMAPSSLSRSSLTQTCTRPCRTQQ